MSSSATTNTNIGDWSETYVFFRLLGDHEISACDEFLNPTEKTFPVLKITRAKDKRSVIICRYNTVQDTWDISDGEAEIVQLSAEEGKQQANELLLKIQDKTKNAAKYSKAIKFLERLHINSVKSDSTHKEDITLQISDVRAGTDPICGFSIKSYLGQPPTLLNSSKDCTNFLYEVNGINPSDIDSLNSIEKTMELLSELLNRNAEFNFVECCSSVFAGNLEAIDTNAEKIIGELLKIHYLDEKKSIAAATEVLMTTNPLKLRKQETYKIVIKRLLEVVALGMTPGTEWNGETDNTSGIIIVKPDGDMVTYHVYNRDAFKQYLYLSTLFDKPSRTRHKYAKLFEKDGKIYIKFAIQVRFCKPCTK